MIVLTISENANPSVFFDKHITFPSDLLNSALPLVLFPFVASECISEEFNLLLSYVTMVGHLWMLHFIFSIYKSFARILAYLIVLRCDWINSLF